MCLLLYLKMLCFRARPVKTVLVSLGTLALLSELSEEPEELGKIFGPFQYLYLSLYSTLPNCTHRHH